MQWIRNWRSILGIVALIAGLSVAYRIAHLPETPLGTARNANVAATDVAIATSNVRHTPSALPTHAPTPVGSHDDDELHEFPRPVQPDAEVIKELKVADAEQLLAPTEARSKHKEDPAVTAELLGLNRPDAITYDPNQPAVSADNANLPPQDEFADQINAGDDPSASDDTRGYGYDDAPPLDANMPASRGDDYFDQIDSDSLQRDAEQHGYGKDRAHWIEPEDVDPQLDPPLDTGAGISP